MNKFVKQKKVGNRKEMLEELYYNVIMKSDGSTFLNEIDVEDCLDYYFEQKERKEMEERTI